MVVDIHDIPGTHRDQIPFAAQGASAATNYIAAWMVPFAAKVSAVKLLFTDDIIGADTDSRNFNLDDNDRSTELANEDYVAGTNATAGTEVSLYAPTTKKSMAAGQNLYLESEQVGNGLATPEGVMIVEYEGA
jgi:hypothetical protein